MTIRIVYSTWIWWWVNPHLSVIGNSHLRIHTINQMSCEFAKVNSHNAFDDVWSRICRVLWFHTDSQMSCEVARANLHYTFDVMRMRIYHILWIHPISWRSCEITNVNSHYVFDELRIRIYLILWILTTSHMGYEVAYVMWIWKVEFTHCIWWHANSHLSYIVNSHFVLNDVRIHIFHIMWIHTTS